MSVCRNVVFCDYKKVKMQSKNRQSISPGEKSQSGKNGQPANIPEEISGRQKRTAGTYSGRNLRAVKTDIKKQGTKVPCFLYIARLSLQNKYFRGGKNAEIPAVIQRQQALLRSPFLPSQMCNVLRLFPKDHLRKGNRFRRSNILSRLHRV